MPRLEVSLLGAFQVNRDATPVSGFAYDKVRALLAYLVVENDRPRRREELAALLWPDQDDRAARHSLSQALFRLRRALDDSDASTPLLLVTSDTVQLNPAAGLRSDVEDFSDLLDACAAHPHREAGRCRACARRLELALHLYRGDLLEGFSLPDSVIFDEWSLVQREHLREQALAALGRLAAFREGRGELERAAASARRLVALDPWREDTVRQLMRLLAWSGQRASALDQFERFRRRLADELGAEPEGETIALLERIRQGSETRPRRDEPIAQRRDVPVQVTGFVGRERELAGLSQLLLDGNCRLITLAGPGGTGKTRLAIQAALSDGASFAGGVVFVPLAGLPATDLLASAIGGALDVLPVDSLDEREVLLRWLSQRELLLVLDNLEHLLDEVDLVGEILDRAPDVQVLVTSRERLNLDGEWVVEVGGLSLPGEKAGLDSSGSEQLFVQRARQLRSGFVPDAGERVAITRLCQVVEGMPLAIEIAAGWLSILSCAEIAVEVERSLGFLATTRRDVEARHRSIQAVFDRSWQLLTEQEQCVFRRLAIFQGGFRRDAAERVAGASLPLLSALASKSLLRRTAGGRYELHELLRQYAAARLNADPAEAGDVRDRHCSYYTDLLARRADDLRGIHQDAALTELEAEIENLRAAWTTAIEHVRSDVIADAVYGFWLFCEITGRHRELQEILQRGIDRLVLDPDSDADPSRTLALGRSLILLGSIFVRTGEHEHGDALVERGLEIVRQLDQPDDIALGLNFRAAFAHARRDDRDEEAFLRESIALSAGGDGWTMPYSLNDLGVVMLARADTAEASRLQQESLAIFREIGDKRGMAFALHNLGVVACQRGDHRQAEELLLEALAIRRDLRHRWGVAMTMTELGIVARETGDADLAGERFVAALRAAIDIHSLPAVLRTLTELASLLADAGNTAWAVRLMPDIVSHPGADALVRSRAGELLDSLNQPVVDVRVVLRDTPEDAIDSVVQEILQHGLPLTPALT
ncbi:MAG: tetratricopeptide repeat protein [Chloroflexota bacterium]|nr:tetratricopeptide repeat protein [Chloroflexota bacterium]